MHKLLSQRKKKDLEKEKLKNDLKSNDNDINDFEKLINKKYEDYKIGEEKLLSKPNPPILPNEPIDVEEGYINIFGHIHNKPLDERF